MCDTIVALGNVTADGSVLLAKNSDREPNEAQFLTLAPRTVHPDGEMVRCTYIQIPQARETYAVLLSKPFWMWGCEMGLNEHGVAIGNEAVFTKEPYARTGLLGMDLMRLALERSTSARQALDTIVQLLDKYGQGGSGGFTHHMPYHNSFLIADFKEAWVLETAGRYWAARQVRDFYTISNGLTIGAEWDLASPNLVEHAVEKKWCRSANDFHFARCYSDRLYTPLSGCSTRQKRTTETLASRNGRVTVPELMALLRDHGAAAGADPLWSPAHGSMNQPCMHAGFGPVRASQSTASFIAHLDPKLITAWATGTSAPCTGIFKPIYPEVGLPDLGPEPAGRADSESLWWQHERLHRAVLRDYPGRLGLYEAERNAIETSFYSTAQELANRFRDVAPAERREALLTWSAGCFQVAREATGRWIERVEAMPFRRRLPLLYGWAWQRFNRASNIQHPTSSI